MLKCLIYSSFHIISMISRQQKIKRVRQLCERVTYQELESMSVQRLHDLNISILLCDLEKEYEQVFREAERIERKKIEGQPLPPDIFSLIFSCFSAEDNNKKKAPTGKIMKDPLQQEQEDQQEDTFLVHKGSKSVKKEL